MRSLRARVILALAVVVGAFALALGVNAWAFARIGRSLDLVNEVYLPLAGISSRMGAAADSGDFGTLLQEARATLDAGQTEDPEERAALNAAQRQIDEVETALRARAVDGVAPLREEILQLGALSDSRITAVSDKTARAQAEGVRTALVSGGVAVLVAVLVLTAARRALRPVEHLTEAVRRMAAGQPLPRLDLVGDDEIATLARAVSTMAVAVAERDAERERRVRSERLATVGQMLAQVTHEVRNPLNALSLNVELLLEDVRAAEFPSQQEAETLAVGLMVEIRRLEAVTERYLDLARRPAPALAPEDPVALARSMVAVEEEALRRVGVDASVVVMPGTDGWVMDMDGGVVRRALLNLLQNASQAGAKHIIVRVGFVEIGRGGALTLAVEDDGRGVPDCALPHLFEPFYTTRVDGTGLGLVVARQSVEDAGGTLTYRPGSPGSVFEIRLSTGSSPWASTPTSG